jgi:hypothetical protein
MSIGVDQTGLIFIPPLNERGWEGRGGGAYRFELSILFRFIKR